MAEQEDVVQIKEVEFLGRRVHIFAQSLNGPCPLLSIANCLLLRNALELPASVRAAGSAPVRQLVQFVAGKILDSNSAPQGAGSAYEANLRANINDCMDVLGKLCTGIDVNIRFNRPTGFEPTAEVAVFDLLDITLLHGWLVDPQDADGSRVLGTRTYNEVTELIIASLDPGSISGRKSLGGKPLAAAAASLPSHEQAPVKQEQQQPGQAAVGDLLGLEVDDTVAAPQPPPASELGGSASETGPGAAVEAPAPQVEAQEQQQQELRQQQGAPSSAADQLGAELDLLAGLTLHDHPGSPAAASAPAPLQQQQQHSPQPAQQETPPQQSSKVAARRDAAVAQSFLESHANQLTVYGLTALHDALRERQLAVFFRNNHFNVIFKYQGSLFLLVTDQGYLRESKVVWERLDAVDGDTQLCGPDFMPYVARSSHSASQAGGHVDMAALNTISPEVLQGLSEADAAAIAEAAGMVPPVRPPQAAMPHEGPNDIPPEVLAAQADADLAMALQLQEEEEAAARREAAEARARMQAQQQQQQQQHQHGQQGQGRPGQQGAARPGYPPMQQQQGYAGQQRPGMYTPQHQQQRVPQPQAAARPAAAQPPPKKEESSCTIM